MATLMKKRRQEVIRKVNVMMSCTCRSGDYSCGCLCIGTNGISNSYGKPEAEMCAILNRINRDYYPDETFE